MLYPAPLGKFTANVFILTPDGWIYTIRNIKEIQNITVEGLQFNEYKITLPVLQGAKLEYANESSDVVSYGGSFHFTVQLDASHSNSALVLKANGKVITPKNGVYTIENIVENQTVTVEGLQINTYTVTFSKGDGYGIARLMGSVYPVPYGGSYYFRVKLDSEYSNSTIVVKANGNILTLKDGNYELNNMKESFYVTIEGVKLNTYVVHVENGSGSGNYEHGTLVNITANKAPEGKVFDQWSSNGDVTFADKTAESTTFTMQTSSVNITALYKDIVVTPPVTPQKPKTPTVKVKVKKTTATISWKKVSGTSGYEVAIAKSKNGTYSKKAVKSLKYLKKGLKKGKTYYIKVRAYKKVDGKKVYSSYSKVKKVKV